MTLILTHSDTTRRKWRRVNPSNVMWRPPGGGAYLDITGDSWYFKSQSYRRANCMFSEPVDRIIVAFENLDCPVEVYANGIASHPDLRTEASGIALPVAHKSGVVNFLSGGFEHMNPTRYFWFRDVYGEVLE